MSGSNAGLYFEELLTSINRQYSLTGNKYEQYQTDPVGFGEQVLNETFTSEVKTLMESVRDNPVTVAQSANATGKTHGAARVAVWWFKCFPDSQVYTSAAPPEGNLKRLLWGEISSVVEKHSELFKSDTITNLNISRSAQSFIAGVTIPVSGSEAVREAKFSGKHAPYLLFILDEGDAVPDEVYRGIESCLSGGHARLLVIFNPRDQVGEAYRMIRDGRANVVKLSAFDHPNVTTGEDKIPGAVTRQTTVRRINEWCRPLKADEQRNSECFKLPEFLEGAIAQSQSGMDYPPLKPGHYKVMNPAFSYMVLGKYPAQGSTKLISREWINAARSRWESYVLEHGEKPPAFTSPIAGLDVAEYGTDANCLLFRYGGFVSRLHTWNGADVLETASRAARICKEKGASRINIDSIGIGAAVPGAMAVKGIPAAGVKTSEKPTQSCDVGEFNKLRDELWWLSREWLRTDTGAMLPPEELLLEELLCPTYAVENGKIRIMQKKVMRELLKRSPDRADALVLTFARSGFFANSVFKTI